MKKSYIFVIIVLIALGIGVGVYFYNSKHKKVSDNSNVNNFEYNSTRVSATNETNQNTSENNTSNSTTNEAATENKTPDSVTNETVDNANKTENPPEAPKEEPKKQTETLISEFSTKIYSQDTERQNNISITCTTLNNTTVNNGETFSFCNTVGKATTAKGYQKADVYQDGQKVQALGGGNCQVSSTLYNAVLKIQGLKVTERHEHSNTVPYVPKGKDAAVAYGSYDFKFVNNTGNTIKIKSSCDKKNVYVKIFSQKE